MQKPLLRAVFFRLFPNPHGQAGSYPVRGTTPECWHTRVAGHFVGERGGKDLDAALLLMPLVRFVGATDPRWLATLDAIGDRLTDDGMVFRHKRDDGLPGKEGAFSACSFWFVECLARAAFYIDREMEGRGQRDWPA